jgi:hypothetical protein
VRERAKRLREEARREAAQRPEVPAEVRLFLRPPNWTRETVARYDANGNGRLEPEERACERRDAIQRAREEFRQADTNGDGRWDATERRATFAPERKSNGR